MNKTNFTPYFPLHINGNIFNDPELSNNEKIIISLAQLMRLQVAYAKSESEQKEILQKFTSSFFAAATGKHRDHIRRLINQMRLSEAVQKYVSIFVLPRIEFNSEHVFRFTFKDHLPDQLNMNRIKTFEDSQDLDSKLDWTTETLIQNYIRSIKNLGGETARSLISLLRCEPSELVKGLVYLKEQSRRKEIKNMKGYLVASFDLAGKFKYDIKPEKYLPSDAEYKITFDFDFEVDKKHFLDLEKALKQDTNNPYRFLYRENGAKIYLNSVTKAGRKLNTKNYLTRNDIPFRIVEKNEFKNV